MLTFEVQRGFYSPDDIIKEQLVPFLLEKGIKKDHILWGKDKKQQAIDDLGKDLLPIDLMIEEQHPRTGKDVPRMVVVVKSPGREIRSFQKQAVALGILSRAPLAMVTDGLTGIILETPTRPSENNEIPVKVFEKGFPTIELLQAMSLGAEPAENLKRIAQQTLRLIKNSNLLIHRLEACDELIERTIVDTRKRFFLLSKFLFAKLMDEKAVNKGQMRRFTVKRFLEAEKESKTLIETMLSEFAVEYGQDLFQNLRLDLDPEIQQEVVGKLEGLDFMASDNDIKGLAYEFFLKSAMRQKDGQFFTPRKVIDFILEMLQPNLGDKVLDPAAGSGGFLIAYFTYQKAEVLRRYYSGKIKENERGERLRLLSEKLIHGVELDEDLARLCKMNMIVHGDGHSRIFHGDGLTNKVQENRTVIGENMFDIIITNPPFGKPKIKKTDERLKHFDLGKKMNWEENDFSFQTQKGQIQLRNQQEPQHLFVERVIRCLKPGGKAAIVLPDGIFNNSSDEYTRRYIMKKCNIQAIISMPDLTFKDANVRTNVIFLQKKEDETVKQEQEIFMGICDNIGYDQNGRSIPENDLPRILKMYSKDKGGVS